MPQAPAPQPSHNPLALWLRAMRWKQWIKNVLVLLPILFAHQWQSASTVQAGLLAFAAFCCAASSVYLVNDLVDRAADAEHLTKRYRPIAAGLVAPSMAWIVMGLLIVIGALAAASISARFLAIFIAYLVTANAYSFGLKQVLLLDVLLLAGFYTLRIFAGSLATGIVVSNWLLLFSMFFFLGLAFQKRAAELRNYDKDDEKLSRRGYMKADLEQVRGGGTTCSYLALLVLALYIQSPEVASHYARPGVLWWVIPCLLYWTSRIWLLAGRGEVSEDAIAFAVKDPVSYIVAALVILTALLASPI